MRTRILFVGFLATAAIVSVAVTSGDASPNLKAFADAMGAAQVAWTLGTSVGINTLQVSALPPRIPGAVVTFTAQARASAVA